MQELINIMSDSTPFFSMAMSSEGLPMSADLQSIEVLPGQSVTDQIASYNGVETTISKFAGVVTGAIHPVGLPHPLPLPPLPRSCTRPSPPCGSLIPICCVPDA